MINRTIICGLALVIIGVYGYIQGADNARTRWEADMAKFNAEKDSNPGQPAPVIANVNTALIPAGFGGVLILCGIVAGFAPKARKHVMHLAAVVGVLGAIGGFMPIILRLSKGKDVSLGEPAVYNGLLMTVVCVVFVVFCVQSFVEARRARMMKPAV